MTIRMDELIKSIAVALDMVENDLLGASKNHGKRIAVLCAAMGRYLGMKDEKKILALTSCALFHDNALTEYILSEKKGARQKRNLYLHCEYGQRNIEYIFPTEEVEGFILYHHEFADGMGILGKKSDEFPLEAALIAIADMLDVEFHFQHLDIDKLQKVKDKIVKRTGTIYTEQASEAMLNILDEEMLISLRDENIEKTASDAIPEWEIDLANDEIFRLSRLAAQIIDYKSAFTKKHSIQIADRAWIMGDYYNYDKDLKTQIYLAAAIHDLGKLSTPIEVLEKPGKLDDDEFAIMKDHIYQTYLLIKDIGGFEKICYWSTNHHEKLDGSGYPFGRGADELDFISRLLVCIDIYQAVSEERPYHPARDHNETMEIMFDMAEKGLIDKQIVNDMNIAMAKYSGMDVPSPNLSSSPSGQKSK